MTWNLTRNSSSRICLPPPQEQVESVFPFSLFFRAFSPDLLNRAFKQVQNYPGNIGEQSIKLSCTETRNNYSRTYFPPPQEQLQPRFLFCFSFQGFQPRPFEPGTHTSAKLSSKHWTQSINLGCTETRNNSSCIYFPPLQKQPQPMFLFCFFLPGLFRPLPLDLEVHRKSKNHLQNHGDGR